MAYVNERIAEDDIRAFGLDELKRRLNPWTWREGRPVGFVHVWVIDRESGIFLLPVKTIEEVGPSGRPEPTGAVTWGMNWKGQWIMVTLRRGAGSSKTFSDQPFVIVWELVAMDLGEGGEPGREEVVRELKAALAAFGDAGPLRKEPEANVQFKF